MSHTQKLTHQTTNYHKKYHRRFNDKSNINYHNSSKFILPNTRAYVSFSNKVLKAAREYKQQPRIVWHSSVPTTSQDPRRCTQAVDRTEHDGSSRLVVSQWLSSLSLAFSCSRQPCACDCSLRSTSQTTAGSVQLALDYSLVDFCQQHYLYQHFHRPSIDCWP